MTVVGCDFELETLAQVELVREWMAQRRVLVLDVSREPLLLKKLQQLAPREVPAIAPEPRWRA